MDDVLEPLLSSPDDDRSEERLGDLLTRHAAPLVRRVVSRRLGSAGGDVDDVCSQVMLQLLRRLRRERIDDNLAAIDVFAGYVATAAHHACDHFIRAKYPLRWRLRCRIRYVLERDARFAIWRAPSGALVGGRAEWRSRQSPGVAAAGTVLAGAQKQDVGELLSRIFEDSGAPVELTAIVDAAAAAWAIPLFQDEGGDALEGLAAREPRVDAMLEQRGRLARVWAQVRELPVRQRHALLLNLKGDAITMFLTTGAASLRDMAAALELPVEQFAALWNELPLADNTLATRLGCTRQQVINLRMAARKRLANHLGPAANMAAGRSL